MKQASPRCTHAPPQAERRHVQGRKGADGRKDRGCHERSDGRGHERPVARRDAQVAQQAVLQPWQGWGEAHIGREGSWRDYHSIRLSKMALFLFTTTHLVGGLHGGDFAGIAASNPAGEQQRRQQRAHLPSRSGRMMFGSACGSKKSRAGPPRRAALLRARTSITKSLAMPKEKRALLTSGACLSIMACTYAGNKFASEWPCTRMGRPQGNLIRCSRRRGLGRAPFSGTFFTMSGKNACSMLPFSAGSFGGLSSWFIIYRHRGPGGGRLSHGGDTFLLPTGGV